MNWNDRTAEPDQGQHMNAPIQRTEITRLRLVVTVATTILGLVSGILGLKEYRERHPGVDVSGEWRLEHTVATTTHPPFQGMRLGYRVFFQQDGKLLRATGEKISENGQPIPSSAHSPITFSGILKGRRLSGTFTEQGARRESTGAFEWTVSADENTLSGTFRSTAASASGPSVGTRIGRR